MRQCETIKHAECFSCTKCGAWSSYANTNLYFTLELWNLQCQKNVINHLESHVCRKCHKNAICIHNISSSFQRGIWSQSSATKALLCTARHETVQPRGWSHNVAIQTFAAKMCGFQKVHGKLWESRMEQDKVNYLFVFCSEGCFLAGLHSSLQKNEAVVSTRSVSQLSTWCRRNNKFVWVFLLVGLIHPELEPQLMRQACIMEHEVYKKTIPTTWLWSVKPS